jgi:magnesium-protoporphyrin O-methyltransferase
VQALAERTDTSLLFTFAPSTRPLVLMHAVGKLFPRGDRAPAIEPVREQLLRTLLRSATPRARLGRDARIASGFYTSHALEVLPG